MSGDSGKAREATRPKLGYAAIIGAALLVGIVAIVVVVSSGGAVEAAECPADAECVTAHTSTGDYTFTVEWAIEPPERSCGLMFRDNMAEDHGMVFDFQLDRSVSFWMRNTLISLDMVFVEADGTVLNIAEGTTPLSEEGVPSDGPVRYVFEVIAGTADRIGLAAGDKIDLTRSPEMTSGTAICFTPN